MKLSTVFSTLALAVSSVFAAQGSLQQLSNFGTNPTNVGIFYYKPARLATPTPLIVAMHYCSGTAQAYFNGSPYKTLSEQYGFIVIYPSSPHSGTCWDVSSKATLSHEGGGDSHTIANMVKWTLNEYKADSSKVFVTGTSSGAMMTVIRSFWCSLLVSWLIFDRMCSPPRTPTFSKPESRILESLQAVLWAKGSRNGIIRVQASFSSFFVVIELILRF